MAERTRLVAMLAGLTVAGTACANPSGGAAPPLAAQNATRERLSISQFSDLPRPRSAYSPAALTLGPDGAIWAADTADQDYGPNIVVRIANSGKRTRRIVYTGGTSQGADLADMTAGPDGALWMTDSYNVAIARMTLKGALKTWSLKVGTFPWGIATGPDGALWFTEDGNGLGAVIGRITTSGAITTYSQGLSSGIRCAYITPGPDGALWFTESIGDRIGRITVTGKITEFSKGITTGAAPLGIVAGPDGALWFTESGGGRIGRITTSGKVTEFAQGITSGERPENIAVGPDSALWFTEYKDQSSYRISGSKIGRIGTTGAITEFSGFNRRSGPTNIVLGSDGNLWFLESNADRMGRVNLSDTRAR